MATKANLRDIGWMYHAPAKKSERPEIMVPPTSQIPGLGNFVEDVYQPETNNRNLIKDTDTPYIILAKQGGRADLLSMPETSDTGKKEAQGYPRCDWFYLADNAMMDTEKAENNKYVPSLPEYMVHEPYNRTRTANSVIMTNGGSMRPPFAIDKRNHPDSCPGGKIPEPRAYGFGYRLEKYKGNKDGQLDSAENQTNLEVRAKQRAKQREDQIQMVKLLSMGYEAERPEIPANDTKAKFSTPKPKMATTTEYGDMYEAAVVNSRKPRGNRK